MLQTIIIFVNAAIDWFFWRIFRLMPEYEISFSMKKTPYTTVEGDDKDEVFDNANEVILNFEDHESGYDFAQWVVENLIIHVKEVKE